MGRINSTRQWWPALALVFACGLARSAPAIYLDQDQQISLRARIYSQASIRTNDSQLDTVPKTEDGQLVQHRNFFNPELDAKLTSYTAWMKDTFLGVLAPDDFSFRLAAWGFYDGIYDYGPRQFHDTASLINSTFGDTTQKDRSKLMAWYIEAPGFNCKRRVRTLGGQTTEDCVPPSDPKRKYTSVNEVFPGLEEQNPHDIYATQRRINELYLNYGKGPVFFRFGRQSISWGESDTVALLDQNNPFDITLGAPGVFEDLEESRIPLWTVRSSVTLFDTLGPLSSAFIEAYWVPGDLDVNTGIAPLLTASPYSPRGNDPQQKLGVFQTVSKAGAQFVFLDKIPKRQFENSRWGVRTQAVVGRMHTLSAWFYTHFPNAPVPVKFPNAAIEGRDLYTLALVHELVPVVGASDAFFFEPLDGIVRAEVEYFNREPSFVPEINLRLSPTNRKSQDPFFKAGSVAHADYIRWELGLDRFFFLRPVNPTNSFTFVTALVGSWNLDETSKKDFRMNGQQKPGTEGTAPSDFVQQKKVEAFMQVHLQTDYMHGRLSPGITYIQNARGTYAINPAVTYRWADWLLFGINYVTIGGDYQQLGFFRDRDQISFRTTVQLN
jgi:hypothetical protein